MTTIGSLAIRFAEDHLDIEQRLVSAGRHDPLRLLKVADDYQLAADSFLDTRLGVVFQTILGCADVGELPGPQETYHDELRRIEGGLPGGPFNRAVRTVVHRLGVDFSDDEWVEMWWAESSASGIDVWGKLVRESADKIDAARKHTVQARELLGVENDDRAADILRGWARRRSYPSGQNGGVRVELSKARRQPRRRPNCV